MKNETETTVKTPIFTTSVAIISLIVLFAAACALLLFTKYSHQNFAEYSKKTAETLAYQASSVIKDTNDVKTPILQSLAKATLHNDKNVMYIEFTDKNNNTIYEQKSNWYNAQKFAGMKVNTPILLTGEDNKLDTAGYLKLSVSSEYIDRENAETTGLIVSFFIFLWLAFIITFVVSRLIMSRELNLLCVGLKHIADGHFGTKIKIDAGKQTKELVRIFNDLSAKLKNYEEQNVGSLLLERNKFEAILMSIVNGVVVCDNNDTIVLINSAAEKMLTVTAEAIQNVQIQSYSDTEGNHCFRDKIEEFKDKPLNEILKNPPEFTISVDKRIIKCVISPMFMQNDDYVGYIIVMIDVTKETEVNNLKNQFISNVSHELRTPVTVLRTYIDTLYTMGDELDEETRKEFTETANKEVTRLHRMVNDILDVSRLESPDVELEKEDANICPIIEDTVTSMQVLANEKNVKITFEKPSDEVILPINVANMERVFNNLISNAIKYSPQDSSIEVVLKKEADCVDISVTDHGCGIEEKHLAKLFDRFYRVENSVHTVKGTGLGLYLVKTTVEKHHGGKVYVKSKVGEGSTFGIKLPLS